MRRLHPRVECTRTHAPTTPCSDTFGFRLARGRGPSPPSPPPPPAMPAASRELPLGTRARALSLSLPSPPAMRSAAGRQDGFSCTRNAVGFSQLSVFLTFCGWVSHFLWLGFSRSLAVFLFFCGHAPFQVEAAVKYVDKMENCDTPVKLVLLDLNLDDLETAAGGGKTHRPHPHLPAAPVGGLEHPPPTHPPTQRSSSSWETAYTFARPSPARSSQHIHLTPLPRACSRPPRPT